MPRKVLVIVDVQSCFVTSKTQPVVDNIRRHLNENEYDVVIQTRWSNVVGSIFDRNLGCVSGCSNEDSEMLIKDDSYYVRTHKCRYSGFTKGVVELLKCDDEIYICGLELDTTVLATCFSFWDAGYTFHVLRDCVGTNVESIEETVLSMMVRQFGICSVV